MNDLFRYLIQSSLCLATFYGVYWLFLRRDTFFTINRIYLLLAMLFSLTVPLFSFQIPASGAMAPVMVLLEPVIITPEKIESIASRHLTWMEVIGVIYLTGTLIFTLRFLIQLIQLWVVVRKNGVTRKEGMKLVFVDKGYSPFSFFNMIFIKKELSEDAQLKAILEHEQVHVRQLHTADLILTEILTIILWFNPFVWFLQRSLKSLHEYLADEGVMKIGFRVKEYQQLIFDQTLGKQINNLTNNFNVSLIKKRIIMMTKSRSQAASRMKIILALPAILLVLASFSSANAIYLTPNAKATQTNPLEIDGQPTDAMPPSTPGKDSIFEKAEISPVFPGGNNGLYAFLGQNIKYPKEAIEKGITGYVYVNFVIEKDGSTSHIKVLKGIGHGCDAEAIRVLQQMPKWKPGITNGKPVRVSYTLPIKFILNNSKKKEDQLKEEALKKKQYQQQQEEKKLPEKQYQEQQTQMEVKQQTYQKQQEEQKKKQEELLRKDK